MGFSEPVILYLMGMHPSLSSIYICVYVPSCFWFDAQLIALAFSLATFNAGRSIPARIAIIAITTRSSIRVKLQVLRFSGEMVLGAV